MSVEKNLSGELNIREQNMYKMFKNLIRDLTDKLVVDLDIDFDGNYLIDTRVIPLFGQLDSDVSGKFPVISEPSTVTYNDSEMHININEEILVFMAYISENIEQFIEFSTILKDGVIINLIKIKMMNDYLLGMSTDKEREYLSCSEQLLKEQIRPNGYIKSFSFKVYAFCRAFFYNEFRQHEYLPALNDEFKTVCEELINERLIQYDLESIPTDIKKDRKLFNDVLSLYNELKHIYGISSINNLKKKLIKSKSLYTSRILLFLDELIEIYNIWDDIKKDTIKKFPKYVSVLKDVRLHCMNTQGRMEVFHKEHKIAGARIPYYDYMIEHSGYCILASMMYSYSKSNGVRFEVQFNIDELLFDYVSLKFKDVSYEQKRFHFEFTLKHEMGHIVHQCEMLYNNSEKTFLMLKHNLEKITDSEKKDWEDLPEDERLDYNYWYYTCLPFERRANELMGLTIEDAYKEHFEEVPPSVKRLLEDYEQ